MFVAIGPDDPLIPSRLAQIARAQSVVFLLLRFDPDIVDVMISGARAPVVGHLREALRDSSEGLSGNTCYANVVAY